MHVSTRYAVRRGKSIAIYYFRIFFSEQCQRLTIAKVRWTSWSSTQLSTLTSTSCMPFHRTDIYKRARYSRYVYPSASSPYV